jgi:hypothetical protein
LQHLRNAFQKAIAELLQSLYPLTQHQETLTAAQLIPFNKALAALHQRLRLANINPTLLELQYDGKSNPLPFPDLHWELATLWMIIDGTIPAPIPLHDGTSINYATTLLHDPTTIHRWKERVRYASTGFKYK